MLHPSWNHRGLNILPRELQYVNCNDSSLQVQSHDQSNLPQAHAPADTPPLPHTFAHTLPADWQFQWLRAPSVPLHSSDFFLRLHWSAEEMLHVRNGSASEMQSFSLPLLHLPSQYSECFHPERSQSQSHISYPPESDLTQPRVIPDYVLSVPSLCGYCFRIRHSAPQYF